MSIIKKSTKAILGLDDSLSSIQNDIVVNTIAINENTTFALTTLSVNSMIESIFDNTSIPVDEVIYILGNGGEINSTIFTDTLETALTNAVYSDFVIANDGTTISVYVKKNITQAHVQSSLTNFPRGYDSIDLNTNILSDKISSLLIDNHTTLFQIFSTEGVMSTMTKELNGFDIMNTGKEFVALYDGTNFTAYKKQQISIVDLQSRSIIQ